MIRMSPSDTSARIQLPEDILQAGPALHCANVNIIPAQEGQGGLQSGIGRVGKMLRAMSHKYRCRPCLCRMVLGEPVGEPLYITVVRQQGTTHNQ